MKRFADKNVVAAFRDYLAALSDGLMSLRELIFDVAAETPGVGSLTEGLK